MQVSLATSEKAPGALAARGLRPVKELGEAKPHGNRLRYMAGCRCTECRGANTQYERSRAKARKEGDWNGFVAADNARAHLLELSAAGVGRRTVCDAADVSNSVVHSIILGRKVQIRARTERLILAVTPAAAADHALVPAKPTLMLLRKLAKDGYSKASLASHLGYANRALQFKDTQVTVRTQHDVQRMFEQLRCCSARDSRKFLAELKLEGYRECHVQAAMEKVAEMRGLAKPCLDTDFAPGKTRVKVSAALILKLAHQHLTA